MKDEDTTPEQLASILDRAFPESVAEYDKDAVVAEQLEFLNKASPGFGAVPLEGPDGADLGMAKFNFNTGQYEWAAKR